MTNSDTDRPGPPQQPDPNPEPQVLALKRGDAVWRMGKREFLKSAVLGAVAAASGCADPKEDDEPDAANAVPPFVVGGTTYRLIALPDYNAELPQEGTNLAVVAYIESDFYFRSFDPQGQLAVSQHESKVHDQAALTDLKQLAKSVAAKRSAEPGQARHQQ